MPKPTKTGAATPAASSTPSTETESNSTTPAGGVDLSKLTPEQLAALQKQLKEVKKVSKDDHKKRFALIDEMLKTKFTKEDKLGEGDKIGDFKYTTREIVNALDADGLIKDKITENWDQIEIKKIQARKQHLEKATDKAGKLILPEGSVGYKPSAGVGFMLTPVRVVSWFTTDNIAKLTTEQRATVLKSLGAK